MESRIDIRKLVFYRVREKFTVAATYGISRHIADTVSPVVHSRGLRSIRNSGFYRILWGDLAMVDRMVRLEIDCMSEAPDD